MLPVNTFHIISQINLKWTTLLIAYFWLDIPPQSQPNPNISGFLFKPVFLLNVQVHTNLVDIL